MLGQYYKFWKYLTKTLNSRSIGPKWYKIKEVLGQNYKILLKKSQMSKNKMGFFCNLNEPKIFFLLEKNPKTPKLSIFLSSSTYTQVNSTQLT